MDALPAIIEAASKTELALSAFLSIAAAGICYYFFKSAPVKIRLIAFLIITLFAFVLAVIVLVRPAQSAKLDSLDLAMVLRMIKDKDARMPACLRLADAATCQRVVAQVADMEPPADAPSAAVNDVAEAAQSGTVTTEVLEKAKMASASSNDRIVSMAKAGLRVDVFWCEGSASDSLRARAQLAANAISDRATLPVGTSIGTVRLRMLSRKAQANPGYLSSGLQVRGETAELPVVNALVSLLNSTVPPGGFVAKPVNFRTPDYVSVFICS